jgi:2-polyprenyl-6-methoxyphenol hydroxylase-like FAD-dependent oxidoreductase
VVGADGRGSQVRRLLKIEHETVGRPECFAVFEFESDAKFSNEVRVVLHKDTSNVLWPLPGNRWRWTFQIAPEEVPDEAHLKERPHFRLVDPPADQEVLRQMHRLVEQRAPWFDAAADELDWFTVIDFEPRVARQYGQDRCWLAGDSAHTTSPIGMQSMNVGLREAVELAHLLTGILRGERSLDSLASYTFRYQNEWRQLLGMGSCITPTQGALPWAQMHSARILPCVPASGDDLVQLLSQIGLTFHKIPANKTTTKEICPDTSLS